MSRKPSTTSRAGGMPRTASQASIAMPPPNRIPSGRPASQQQMASSMSSGNGEASSRAASPRKTSVSRRNGVVPSKAAGEGETNIQVVVRCRGRSSQELAAASPVITTTEGALAKAITIETTPSASSSLSAFTTASSYGGGGPTTKTYPFDKVFGPEADQTMVFREVAEGMLDEVLAGYNCTIFAYGQTGTGKTYTMQGDLELSPLSAPTSSAGIVPRVLHRLFSLLESQANTEYTVRCSYVELYNEELRDLLSAEYSPVASGDKQPMSMGNGGAVGGLKLYEDGKKGVMIQGLEECGVKTLKEALGLVDKGCQRRQVAETKMNTESSRSHTIFSITVHVKESSLANGGDDLLRIGKFNLVDLAGSEAIGRSGATDKRAREAGMINQSLLTLGRVISALTEKSSHIPYRESKLTRLLQDSLGGRTKTCIVATVSPTRSNMEETLSTLDYAIRAKSIRNRPEVNAHLTKSGVLKEYLGDIERLKAEVMAAREKNGIYVPEESWREMHEAQTKLKSEYDEAKLRANAATVELETKRKEFDLLSERFLLTTQERDEAREAERELGVLIEATKAELDIVKDRLEEEVVVSKAFEKGEQKLAGVASGLKGVAVESVKDVGGLFEKIDRKAKVLGGNADMALAFGNDMRTLSKDVRAGLDKLGQVQGRFGDDLREGLDSYTKHAQKHSKRDLDQLEVSFTAFNTLAASLEQSIQDGKLDAAETGRQLVEVKEAVQGAVQKCTTEMQQRSGELVKEVLESHAEQMSTISNILESTSDLVDAVIQTASQHVLVERQAAESSRIAADKVAQTEIARLQAQNVMLARLLQDEKRKTASLRTELIGNLTNLIVGFTDTQEASLDAAITSVQSANEEGMGTMQAYAHTATEVYEAGEIAREQVERELRSGAQTSGTQRAEGARAVGMAGESLKGAMGVYGQQVQNEMGTLRSGLDGVCERFGEVAGDASSRAAQRASQQSAAVQQLSEASAISYESTKVQITKNLDGMRNLSEALLSNSASTSKSYAKHQTSTLSKLASLQSATSTFIEAGIHEDVPTGETPRKKQWNVPATWERVQPRDRLVEAFRQRRAMGLPESEETSDVVIDQAQDNVQEAAAEVPLPKSRSASPVGDPAGLSAVRSSDSVASMASGIASAIPPPAPMHAALPRVPSSSGIPTLSTSQMRGKRDRVVSATAAKMAPLGENGMNVPLVAAVPARRGEKRR